MNVFLQGLSGTGSGLSARVNSGPDVGKYLTNVRTGQDNRPVLWAVVNDVYVQSSGSPTEAGDRFPYGYDVSPELFIPE